MRFSVKVGIIDMVQSMGNAGNKRSNHEVFSQSGRHLRVSNYGECWKQMVNLRGFQSKWASFTSFKLWDVAKILTCF